MRDNEAVVIAVNGNEFTCQLTDKRQFKTNLLEHEMKSKPKVGDVITFKYSNVSKVGLPLSPILCKIRQDLNWDDVVAHRVVPLKKSISNDITFGKQVSNLRFPHGYWTESNMRQFLDSFALNRYLDPQNPDHWYIVTKKEITDAGGSGILAHFGKLHSKAIAALYPEVAIFPHKFATQRLFRSPPNLKDQELGRGTGHIRDFDTKNELLSAPVRKENDVEKSQLSPAEAWLDVKNRRKFFDQFAYEMGFHPLDVSSWYNVSRKSVLQQKGGSHVLSFYNNSHIKALMQLYPELPLEAKSFRFDVHANKWKETKTRRKFFDELAFEMKFDPIVEYNKWYTVSYREVISKKGGIKVLKYHKNSQVTAILDLYPELKLKRQKFHRMPNVQRQFFDNLARDKGFDPSNCENWYGVSSIDVLQKKGGRQVVALYKMSHALALAALYPELKLDTHKFDRQNLDLKM